MRKFSRAQAGRPKGAPARADMPMGPGCEQSPLIPNWVTLNGFCPGEEAPEAGIEAV